MKIQKLLLLASRVARYGACCGILVTLIACASTDEASEAGALRESNLILNIHNGQDDVWNASERLAITYCVSTSFGAYYARAVHEMHQATQDWERAAYVNFIHLAQHDATCTPESPLVFAVEPIFLGGEAGAEAFPPSLFKAGEEFVHLGIALSAYDTLDPATNRRTSRGTFSHELGHILGFRHEHIRPEARQAPHNYDCFDEPVSEGYDPWRTIPGASAYDAHSVMHYGSFEQAPSCGPLKDYVMSATDRAAAHRVYPSPLRCEVWLGATRLGTSTLTPTSAADGENQCRTYANGFQNNNRLFSAVERRADHFRAVLISSASKPCAFTDSVLFFTPGVGFRRPGDVVFNELLLGRVAWDVPDSNFDDVLMAVYGSESAGQIGYLYDVTHGFMKNGLSRNVSFCGNDDSMPWEIARTNLPIHVSVNGQLTAGTLRPLSYGSYTLSIDGMGGNDAFYGGTGADVFTDLSGDNAASGFEGNDTLKLCNWSSINCGSGGSDRALTCGSDTTGTLTGCETRITF